MLLTGDKVGERLGNPMQLPESDLEDSKDSQNMNGSKSTSAPKPQQSASYSHSSNTYMDTSTHMDTSALGTQITHPISSLSPYQNK